MMTTEPDSLALAGPPGAGRFPPVPRRVLLTADTVGGVWTFALELARGLARHDVQVVLATMGAPIQPAQRAQLENLPDLIVEESSFKLEWMQDPWRDLERSGEWLLGLARDHAVDVVHLSSFSSAALPWSAPTVVTAHSCVASWWRAVRREALPPAWNRYSRIVRRGLEAANAVVAPTRAMARALLREHGDFGGTQIIPNGRDPGCAVPDRKACYILGVGRLWDEAKNVAALARVAPDLPWPVMLAGDTRSPEGRQARLPLVNLLGPLPAPELAVLQGRAAIFASPARYEPFGYSVLEAAFAGCALVLGDIESLRENWEDAAIFVPPDDSAAWRDVLIELVHDHTLRRRLARAALVRARRFTGAAMAASYHSLYAALVGSRTAPAIP